MSYNSVEFYEKCLSIDERYVELKLGGVPSVSKKAIMKYPYYWSFLPYLQIFDFTPNDFEGYKFNNKIRQNGIYITCEWQKIDPDFIKGFVAVYNRFYDKFHAIYPEILNPFSHLVKLLRHYGYKIKGGK